MGSTGCLDRMPLLTLEITVISGKHRPLIVWELAVISGKKGLGAWWLPLDILKVLILQNEKCLLYIAHTLC